MTPEEKAAEARVDEAERARERAAREERHADHGRVARGSSRSFVSRSVQESPAGALLAASLVTALTTFAGTTAVRAGTNPTGATGAQIEAVLGEMKTLAKKVDELAGDVRSIREADLTGRMRVVEAFIIKQEEANREQLERRHGWDHWREGDEEWRHVADEKISRVLALLSAKEK